MTDQTPSTNTTPTGKIIIGGIGIALGSIFLFGAIWLGLGQLGIGDAVRLILAICIPPAIMTIGILWLYVTRRPDVSGGR